MRYRATYPHDDAPMSVGDTVLIGVNMRLAPHMLPPGYASESINGRFRNGIWETRKGTMKVTWMNKISGSSVQPWGTVYGTGEFKDPNTFTNYTIIAADGNVYFVTENAAPTALAMPTGVTITSNVTFTQAYDRIIMFRGTALPELEMLSVDTGFRYISQSAQGTGTSPIPNASRGVFFQNRVFVANDNDEIAVSDFGDYTRFQPVVQELKVNQGSSDSIVNLAKFSDTTVLVFKEHSIYALYNIYGDLSAAQQDQITDEFGLAAADSVAHCGSDFLFLSEMGVMSLRQTEQNKLQCVTLPLSDPIQPLIDRINWKYAGGAFAAYWDNKYYLAVPLDDAEILGPEIFFGRYPSTQLLTIPVTTGARYRWIKGTADTQLANGTETLTASHDFTAQGSTVIATGVEGVITDGSIKRVYAGVNNAILVYDFLNKAWAGYDQADGMAVKRFHIRQYRNTPRLWVFDYNGWTKLYEEDFEDHLSVPYVDVIVSTLPANGNTVRVNGGTTVTVAGSSNGAATWGAGTIAGFAENLWTDGNYGYSPSSLLAVWTSPNTTPAWLTGQGVRFYASNGVLPTVVTTGSWATVNERVTQQISSTLVTRSYLPDGDLCNFDWLCMDVQTWNPNYSVSLITDGVSEETTVRSEITKSRTRYTMFGRAGYDTSNVNGDHATNHREDYSIALGTNAIPNLYLTNGVVFDRHQEFREEFKVKKFGRAAKVKLACTQGRLRVMGLKLENRRRQDAVGQRT